MTNFYTYLWFREDGTPYYVGKGKGHRGYTSAAHGVKRPKDRSRIRIRYWDSESEAFDAERKLISRFGRKDTGTGCLRNLTDGGDGPAGMLRPDLAERNRSWRGRKLSEKTKKLMSEQRKGVPHSESHRKALVKHLQRVKGQGATGIHNAGGHLRWHVTRAIVSSDCRYCKEAA